jgi:protein-disulfide isomerase
MSEPVDVRRKNRDRALSIVGFLAALGIGYYVGRTFMQPEVQIHTVIEQRMAVELRGDEPSKGPADALVTIVEFSDFECPYCAKAVAPMMAAVAKHDDDVRVLFKHYPLPFHRKALPAARIAWAADRQGKFWEIHDHLFGAGADISAVRGEAEKLGMDVDKLVIDAASPEASTALDSDFRAGAKLGIGATPMFLVNGHAFSGVQSERQWEEILDAELSVAEQLLDQGTPRANLYEELMRTAMIERPAPKGFTTPSERGGAAAELP